MKETNIFTNNLFSQLKSAIPEQSIFLMCQRNKHAVNCTTAKTRYFHVNFLPVFRKAAASRIAKEMGK